MFVDFISWKKKERNEEKVGVGERDNFAIWIGYRDYGKTWFKALGVFCVANWKNDDDNKDGFFFHFINNTSFLFFNFLTVFALGKQ